MDTDRNESHRVDVWHVDLDASPDQISYAQILSGRELERAARFHSPVHRRRFAAGRAALRRILAAEVGVEPHTITFRYGPCGKPELDGCLDVRFNMSHADRRAVIAVGRNFDLGVDIEPLRSVASCEDLAALVFSDGELHELAHGGADKSRMFLNGWTRKEAYVKALGTGFGESLRSFSVSLLGRAALLDAGPSGGSVSDWTLLDVDAAAYVVAFAARAPGVSVHVHS